MQRSTVWNGMMDRALIETHEQRADGDYKDSAGILWGWISDRLMTRPRLRKWFSDMPDGESCPRWFWSYRPTGKSFEQ